MLQNLLTSSLPDGYQEVSIGTAALYAVIGQLVVFAGIAFLVFVVWAVGKGMAKVTELKKQSAATPASPKEIEQPTMPIADEVSEETIAVIMAALMTYYEENNPKCSFTVKRIKRI